MMLLVPQLCGVHIYWSGTGKRRCWWWWWWWGGARWWWGCAPPVFSQNENLLNRRKPRICTCFNMQTPSVPSRVSCPAVGSKVRWRNLVFVPICFVFIRHKDSYDWGWWWAHWWTTSRFWENTGHNWTCCRMPPEEWTSFQVITLFIFDIEDWKVY